MNGAPKGVPEVISTRPHGSTRLDRGVFKPLGGGDSLKLSATRSRRNARLDDGELYLNHPPSSSMNMPERS